MTALNLSRSKSVANVSKTYRARSGTQVARANILRRMTLTDEFAKPEKKAEQIDKEVDIKKLFVLMKNNLN